MRMIIADIYLALCPRASESTRFISIQRANTVFPEGMAKLPSLWLAAWFLVLYLEHEVTKDKANSLKSLLRHLLPSLTLHPWVESACLDRVLEKTLGFHTLPFNPSHPLSPPHSNPDQLRRASERVSESPCLYQEQSDSVLLLCTWKTDRPLCLGPELIFQDSETGSVPARQECGFCLTLFLHFIN